MIFSAYKRDVFDSKAFFCMQDQESILSNLDVQSS